MKKRFKSVNLIQFQIFLNYNIKIQKKEKFLKMRYNFFFVSYLH